MTEQGPGQRMEMYSEQELKISALVDMEGLEVLENIGEPFVRFYTSFKNDIVSSPIDKTNVVVLSGRSGGKDTIASQIFRKLEADNDLFASLVRKNRRLKLNYVAFADCEVGTMHDGIVKTPRGQHNPEDYEKISYYMWEMVSKTLHAYQPGVTIVQLPTPTAYISKRRD